MREKNSAYEGLLGKYEGKEHFVFISVDKIMLLKWTLKLEGC
jgi:hypothetical protein